MELIICFLSAYFTLKLSRIKFLDSVRSSSLISLVGCFIISISGLNMNYWAIIVFGGSFIGMTTLEKFSIPYIFLASTFYFLFFSLFYGNLNGIGGTIGFFSFMSVNLTLLVLRKTIQIKA